MPEWKLKTPLTRETVCRLQAGDRVLLSGTIYTARDSAHRRLVQLLEEGAALPIELNSQTIYYAGPAPAPPGKPIGSVGPTTSYRMDAYTPALLSAGLTAMIGKGSRSREVRDAMVREGAVYLAAWGGAGALLASRVREASCVAFEDLGPEAIYRLEVEDFPLIVVNDCQGRDYYEITGGKGHE